MNMLKLTAGACAGASALALLALAGCGREADRASRSLADDRAPAEQPARPERVSRAYVEDRSYAPAAERVAQARASSLAWASSRRGSAEDNARRQFERNGQDFGAASVQAYVDKASAFASDPPRGVLTSRRSNGDRIFYDPRTNTFLAADRSGLPRTMFKPREGRAYWDQQVGRLAQGSGAQRARGGGGRDGSGSEDARG
jgi:pyocin large subunit-like protein